MIKVKVKNVFGIEVHSVNIDTLVVNLGNSARATVTLLDKENHLVGSRDVQFSEDEYKGWGEDDSYIENLILGKLELERDEPTVEGESKKSRRKSWAGV